MKVENLLIIMDTAAAALNSEPRTNGKNDLTTPDTYTPPVYPTWKHNEQTLPTRTSTEQTHSTESNTITTFIPTDNLEEQNQYFSYLRFITWDDEEITLFARDREGRNPATKINEYKYDETDDPWHKLRIKDNYVHRPFHIENLRLNHFMINQEKPLQEMINSFKTLPEEYISDDSLKISP